jgi:hypothetical protein
LCALRAHSYMFLCSLANALVGHGPRDREARMSSEDRDHPVLPDAWRYQIVGLHLELKPESEAEPFLDLTLELDGSRHVLRFFGPQSLEIEEGGPASGGLKILDVSGRQLNGLRVRVDDDEASSGSLRFWARDVAPI